MEQHPPDAIAVCDRAGATKFFFTRDGMKIVANITSQMVKELREKTGAGMMDCKAALVDTAGELEAAVDWLRKKGLAKAAKKAGRIAADGLVCVALADGRGIVIEVNSETDFVARNDHFQGLVKMIAHAALKTGPDLDAIRAAPVGSATVADAIASAIATIGENMTLRRAAALNVEKGALGSYVHGAVADGLGKIGVLVALESSGDVDELAALARQIAMHVAASNPQAIDAAGLDPGVVAKCCATSSGARASPRTSSAGSSSRGSRPSTRRSV
jgi:elongation factor Ts